MPLQQHRLLLKLVFLIYVVLLTVFILFKYPQTFKKAVQEYSLTNLKNGKRKLVLFPFQTTYKYLSGEKGFWPAVANLGGNIFGFMPMGLLLPLLFPFANSKRKTVLLVACTSCLLEIIQFFVGVGYCDVDDVWQNMLGGLLGFLLYKKLFGKNQNPLPPVSNV